jgi:hypothetical protein
MEWISRLQYETNKGRRHSFAVGLDVTTVFGNIIDCKMLTNPATFVLSIAASIEIELTIDSNLVYEYRIVRMTCPAAYMA